MCRFRKSASEARVFLLFIYGHLCKLSVGFVTKVTKAMGFIAEYVIIS
jgi:hypothetical protein